MIKYDQLLMLKKMNHSLNKENFAQWINEDYFENKHIVITGGCGFIGSWLSSTICHMGGNVFCIDNLSTGITKNLEQLKQMKNFEFLKQDVQTLSCDELPKKADIVLHCASRASPEDYRLYPIDTLESNSIGTKKLLEYSLKNHSLFLFTSSSEIYGDPKVVPTPESYYGSVNTMGERSCYDEGKRYGEALIHAFHKTYDLDVRVVRIFNTFGPGLRPDGAYGRALPKFIFQCLENKPITIFGDGNQTRSFNFITDTIAGIMGILSTKSFNGIPVNVGNDYEITILDLAKKIKKITKSNSEISFLPPASDDPLRRRPDTSCLRDIGWKPKVSLEDGLKETIEWIRNNYV